MAKKTEPEDEMVIVAQISGYKNLKIEGGFRLQLDIFESRKQDVAACALLANERKTVEVHFKPYRKRRGRKAD